MTPEILKNFLKKHPEAAAKLQREADFDIHDEESLFVLSRMINKPDMTEAEFESLRRESITPKEIKRKLKDFPELDQKMEKLRELGISEKEMLFVLSKLMDKEKFSPDDVDAIQQEYRARKPLLAKTPIGAWRIGELMKELQKNHPDVWQFMSPKIYKDADNWHDPRMALYVMSGAVRVWLTAQQTGEDLEILLSRSRSLKTFAELSEMKLLMVISALAAKFKFPIFFLDKKLLQAAMQTEPMDLIDWQTMALPFPTMSFMMPRGSASIDGDELAFVQFSRSYKGTYSLFEAAEAKCSIEVPEDQLQIKLVTAGGVTYYNNFNKPFDSTAKLLPPPELIAEFYDPNEINELTGTEAEQIHQVCCMIFNVLFAMLAKPELVETGRQVGRHKKSSCEIWQPNIIGRKYAHKHAAGSGAGSGESKRMHWRRGHFRQQKHGSGFSLVKTIWIEPVLVGLKGDK